MQKVSSMVHKAIMKAVTEIVLQKGSFIVSEISEATGYSITTISKYVNELIKDDKISEIEKINLHTKGRKAIKYGVKNEAFFFLGVDPRPFDLKIQLINLVGEVIKKYDDPNFILENSFNSLDSICDKVLYFMESLPSSINAKIKSININLPGRINSKNGTSSTFFKFEGSENEPLDNVLTERFGKQVYIENDTKAMTFGEYHYVTNESIKNICYVNMSWGLGVGLILDGKLYNGKDGYSGEFGHTHAYDNNILCHCGKKGCIETEVSGLAISRKIKERIKAGETSILSPKVCKGENITIFDILSSIEKEDALTLEILSNVGSELGHHLSGIINLLNPDMIIIGGNFACIESCYFLQYIKLAIRQYSLKLISKDLPVLSSRLGSDAGVVGACLLARARYLNMDNY